jgi:protein gp37
MTDRTGIEWTNATWNPIRGCSRVSAGCMRCYAERQAIRQIGGAYAGLIQRTSHGPAWTGEIRVVPELLDQPLRWSKPRRIFVNSMSDLFHESVPFEFIGAVFSIMAVTSRHTYQILTKRPARMREFFAWALNGHAASAFNSTDRITGCWPAAISWQAAGVNKGVGYDNCGAAFPFENVWLGVSVEDQETADERIPLLQQTPAAVRFVSYEPALGPVDFSSAWLKECPRCGDTLSVPFEGGGKPCPTCLRPNGSQGGVCGIDWVIVGGESGPKARPCDIAWIRSAVEQCKAASVPVFVKQIGAKPKDWCVNRLFSDDDDYEDGFCDFEEAGESRHCGDRCCMLSDRKGGDMAEWPEDLRVREFPR